MGLLLMIVIFNYRDSPDFLGILFLQFYLALLYFYAYTNQYLFFLRMAMSVCQSIHPFIQADIVYLNNC